MAGYAQGSSRASNIQIKKSEAIDEVHPLGGYPVVRKLERKAGASISALVDKYPALTESIPKVQAISRQELLVKDTQRYLR